MDTRLNRGPPLGYVQTQISRTSECDLLWKISLGRWNEIKDLEMKRCPHFTLDDLDRA